MTSNISCTNHKQLLLHKPNFDEDSFYSVCSSCLTDFDKQRYNEEMNQFIIDLVNEIKQLQDEIKQFDGDQSDFYIQLNDGVKLEGPIKNGRKQGDFYYKFDDGTKQYAGQYNNNLKEGVWYDFVSYKCQMNSQYLQETICIQEKLKKTNISFYINGIKQPKYILDEQTSFQISYQIEKYGLDNQLTHEGKYNNKGKIKDWILYEGQIVGGGNYLQSVKYGFWREPSLKYDQYHRITFSGKYVFGQPCGHWEIQNDGFRIGGGFYNKDGNKSGHWTDISDDYGLFYELTQRGYYDNGCRNGQWRTYYSLKEIGGGYYDEKGMKQGFWIDFGDNYWEGYRVTQYGNYKNGLRIGSWITQTDLEIIDSGCYDEYGMKQGDWIELCENFMIQKIKYYGKYKNGIRIGKWTMIHQEKEIGYGNYDDNGVKQGFWIELYNNFWENNQITQAGFYNNGLRQGKWRLYNGSTQIKYYRGGGFYDDQGNKTGQWIDLHDNYFKDNKVTEEGEYNQGLRIGQWDVCYNQNIIGGGNYNERGQKQGSWIDVQIRMFTHTFYFGEYKNGQRIGLWTQTTYGIDSFYAQYQLNPKTQIYEIK